MQSGQDAFEAAMTRYLTTLIMNIRVVVESQARADGR